MKKNHVLWIILDLVFLVIFNAIFFLVGRAQHEASVWIAYGFIHFSYFMLLIAPFLIRKSTNTAVLGLPIYTIASFYFFSCFFVGILFFFTRPENYKVCFVVELIMFGVYAVILISNMLANEHTADSLERHEMELRYVKDCSSRIKGIMSHVSDKKMQKQLETLHDLIHSSPVKSNNAARDYELKVIDTIDLLQSAVIANDINTIQEMSRVIRQNAEERNQRLKYGN